MSGQNCLRTFNYWLYWTIRPVPTVLSVLNVLNYSVYRLSTIICGQNYLRIFNYWMYWTIWYILDVLNYSVCTKYTELFGLYCIYWTIRTVSSYISDTTLTSAQSDLWHKSHRENFRVTLLSAVWKQTSHWRYDTQTGACHLSPDSLRYHTWNTQMNWQETSRNKSTTSLQEVYNKIRILKKSTSLQKKMTDIMCINKVLYK